MSATFQVWEGAGPGLPPGKRKYNVNNRTAEGVKNSAEHFCNVDDGLYNRVEKMELPPLHRRETETGLMIYFIYQDEVQTLQLVPNIVVVSTLGGLNCNPQVPMLESYPQDLRMMI